MNTSPPIPGRAGAGEPTTAYDGSGVPAGDQAPRRPVALVPGSRPLHFAEETRALLRKRLLLIFTICAGVVAFVAGPLFMLRLLWGHDGAQPAPPVHYGIAWFLLVLWVVLAVILRSKRPLSLFQLRCIELIGFGVLALVNAWWTYQLFRTGSFPRYASPDGVGTMLLASHTSLKWFSLMVIYGVFVPSTWRRCAAVVCAMALTPFVISLAAGVADEALDGRVLTAFLLWMGFWALFGAAIAIYGSHKISLLRREAFEARKLGQYQLQQRLGAGGMGEVYLAEHVLLRRPCAIKLIRPDRAGDPKTLRRFEREVQATATLTHPNTVQIFDYGHAEDGTFYYVMEYLPGLTVEQLVQQHGPVPPARAIHFLRQLCGALGEAHAIGLIHRDIKPTNVMACARGGRHDVVKLLDFGLVVAQDTGPDGEKLTQEGAIAGTPAYMSPEQAAGQETVDARSDIYSLGALAYFLLTGQPPFAGRSAVKMLAAHIYEPPAPLTNHRPEVSAELQAVVLRCLAKGPAERFGDAVSLEKALAGCHTVDLWNEEEAASWWRSQLGPNGRFGSDRANEELGRTKL